MNQIPDEAAERVLGTIREAIDLDARDQRAEASRVLKQMVDRVSRGLDPAQLHGMDPVALRAAPGGD